MAWTKAKTAVVVGVAILLAGGTTFVAVKNVRHVAGGYSPLVSAGGYSWQVFDPAQAGTAFTQALPTPRMPRMVSMAQGGSPNDAPSLGDIALASSILAKTPPQVTVVPTRFPNGGTVNGVHTRSWMCPFHNERAIGMNCPADDIIRYAMGYFSFPERTTRTIVEAKAAEEGYDFIANLPDGSKAALKAEAEQKFGLTGTIESRPMDVLVLKAKRATAGDELKGTRIAGMGASQLLATSTSDLAKAIEMSTGIPVVDETGLANRFMLTLKWNEGDKPAGAEQFKLSLDEIGLELEPGRKPVDMLVIQKTK